MYFICSELNLARKGQHCAISSKQFDVLFHSSIEQISIPISKTWFGEANKHYYKHESWIWI